MPHQRETWRGRSVAAERVRLHTYGDEAAKPQHASPGRVLSGLALGWNSHGLCMGWNGRVLATRPVASSRAEQSRGVWTVAAQQASTLGERDDEGAARRHSRLALGVIESAKDGRSDNGSARLGLAWCGAPP